jgi:transposase-like protein
MIKTIFAQETSQEAQRQWQTIADALRDRAPKLAEMMDAAREDVLAPTGSPPRHAAGSWDNNRSPETVAVDMHWPPHRHFPSPASG